MVDIKKKLGTKIFESRKQAGLTQAKLSEKAGLSIDSISRIERGIRSPSFESLENIAYALGLEIKDLFNFRGRDFKELTKYKYEVLKLCSYLNDKDDKNIKQLEKIAKIICEG
ncbi:MAG: helix-turn-helix transcriptional regulator [Deltaproteobacteria bacterium]|nr:helix-turn-helix transcriptional regulator [Deltaproteobacteria bacterium]MCD6264855.1 helix-turn-helix transcriptional regulator [Deltaproteobacteria bacterium]